MYIIFDYMYYTIYTTDSSLLYNYNGIYIQGRVFDQNGIFNGKGIYVQSAHPHPKWGEVPPRDPVSNFHALL